MADMQAQVIVSLVDRLTPAIRKMAIAIKTVRREGDALNRSSRGGNNMAKQFSAAEVRARRLRMELGKLPAAYAKVKTAAAGLAKRGLIGAGGVIAAKGAVALGVINAMLEPAKAFEQYRLILKTLEGSQAKAEKSFAWVKDFATTTPYEIGQVMEAFVRLRSYGLDPTNGLLRTLGDTSAAMGKDVMDAVEAAADAVTGENERLKAFGITSSKKGNKVTYNYTDKDGNQKKLTVDLRNKAKVLEALMKMWEKNAGAMDNLSQGWTGLTSNLADFKTNFLDMVANTGPFQKLKDNLRGVLDTLNEMQANGKLEAIAEKIGKNLTSVIDKASMAAKGMWKALLIVMQVLDRLATAAGGYENLGYFAVALFMVGKALGLVMAVAEAATILTKIAALGGAGTAAGLMATAGGLAAIAGALYLIQQYEPAMVDKINSMRPDPKAKPQEPWFDATKYDIPMPKMVGTDAAAAAGQMAREWVQAFGSQALAQMQQWGERIGQTIAEKRDVWVARLREAGPRMITALQSGLGSLYDEGVSWMQSLLDGIVNKASEVINYVTNIGGRVKGAFGGVLEGLGLGTDPSDQASPEAGLGNRQEASAVSPMSPPSFVPAPQAKPQKPWFDAAKHGAAALAAINQWGERIGQTIAQKRDQWAGYMREAGPRMVSALESGLGSLYDTGVNWMQSLLNGIIAKVGGVINYVAGIGSRVKAAIGNLGGIGGGSGGGGAAAAPGTSGMPSVDPMGNPVGDTDGVRAFGGSMSKGLNYRINEREQEVITPNRHMAITPLSKLGSGGTTVNVTVNAPISGNADSRTLAKLADMIKRQVEGALHDGAYAT